MHQHKMNFRAVKNDYLEAGQKRHVFSPLKKTLLPCYLYLG